MINFQVHPLGFQFLISSFHFQPKNKSNNDFLKSTNKPSKSIRVRLYTMSPNYKIM